MPLHLLVLWKLEHPLSIYHGFCTVPSADYSSMEKGTAACPDLAAIGLHHESKSSKEPFGRNSKRWGKLCYFGNPVVGTHGHGHGAPKVDSIIATCRCSRAFLGASVVRRRLIRHCKLHRVLVLHQSIAAEQAAALSEFFLMGRRGILPRKLLVCYYILLVSFRF